MFRYCDPYWRRDNTMDTSPVFIYKFNNRTRVVAFGPYRTEDEAKSAFQRVYGYWPEDPVSVVEYE